jgi:hypothetical protein
MADRTSRSLKTLQEQTIIYGTWSPPGCAFALLGHVWAACKKKSAVLRDSKVLKSLVFNASSVAARQFRHSLKSF